MLSIRYICPLNLVLFLVVKELLIFDFEYDDGMYGAVPYVLSQLIGNLPVDLFNGFLYALVVYHSLFHDLFLICFGSFSPF
jgi:hypothetical protein